MIVQDIRYGLRAVCREWIASLVAIVSVALGIGANVALFSLIDSLLLRPLSGVRAPHQLVRIDVALPSTILDDLGKEPVFTAACGISTPLLTTEFHGSVEPMGVLSLAGECPGVFGINAELGRMLATSDDRPATPSVAVLTDAFWRRAFAGRADAIGSTIRIDGLPFTIVGVADPEFQGILLGFAPGILIAAAHDPSSARISQGTRPYSIGNVFARLGPGVTLEQAQARLRISERRLLEQSVTPEYHGERRQAFLSQNLNLLPGTNGLDYFLRARYGRPLEVSLGICFLVLLVSCVNLANLLLARGVRRRRDIALRFAVGAKRGWIVRQLTIESFLLVVAGSIGGIGVAYGADLVLLTQLKNVLGNFTLEAHLDVRVLAFMLLVTLVTGVGFGVIPAWGNANVNLMEVLKSANRGLRVGGLGSRVLVAVQIALTLALVASTGLFVSSLEHLRAAPLGYRVENVAEAQLFPVPDGYKNFSQETYYRELLKTVESMPGVDSASLSNFAPLFSNRYPQQVRFTGDSIGAGTSAQPYWVSDNFLRTMAIPLIAGHDFGRADSIGTPRTAIVSQSLARRMSPTGDIIGRHLRLGTTAEDQDLEVIGIAADAKLSDVRADPAVIYINIWQYTYSAKYGVVVVRAHDTSSGFLRKLQQAVRGAGREYVQSMRTLDVQRDNALLPERLLALLSSAFGVLALALAFTGLYGLMAYHVASRTGEIGIRMALGATAGGVRSQVLREALSLAVMGCAGGVLLAIGAGRFISTLLYGVRPFDPAYFAVAAGVLLATSVAAAWIPAHRASRQDPMTALRHE